MTWFLRRCTLAGLTAILLTIAPTRAAAPTTKPAARIVWDLKTLTLIHANGAYARMIRVKNAIVCCFENRRSVYVRTSVDEGAHWGDAIKVASFEFGSAANPELLALRDGRLLCFYNARPRDKVHPYSIEVAESRDQGMTWTVHPKSIYVAGADNGTGCYEPAGIQLDDDEIQLFFANEFPHRGTGQQEISLTRSTDGGKTWSTPDAVSFRKGSRDGMPVPVVLQDGRGTVMAIEDNGLTPDHQFKPSVIRSESKTRWTGESVDATSPRRWSAVTAPWPTGVYAGAPYLRQMPSGMTVLSCQSDEGKALRRMVVYVGDADAKNFAGGSQPFPTDAARTDLWNALFVKNRTTVTAISSTTVRGVPGIWAIDGQIAPEE